MMFYSYVMNILIFQVRSHTFHDFSIPKVIFHDLPDLENFYFKFHDFPRPVQTLIIIGYPYLVPGKKSISIYPSLVIVFTPNFVTLGTIIFLLITRKDSYRELIVLYLHSTPRARITMNYLTLTQQLLTS